MVIRLLFFGYFIFVLEIRVGVFFWLGVVVRGGWRIGGMSDVRMSVMVVFL